MRAPKPINLQAMADAWDDPIAFAAQLATYYKQLELVGYRLPETDITATRKEATEREEQVD